MLVLTRKPGERIVIGPNISVVLVAVSGKHVRLGIEAPADVEVRRAELPGGGDRIRARHGCEISIGTSSPGILAVECPKST